MVTGDFGSCPESYLEEGQAVLVFTLVLVTQVEVVEGPAEWGWLGKLLEDLYGAGWEDPTDSIDFPLVPVLIQLSPEEDDISLIKPQVTRILPSVVAQGLCSRHLQCHGSIKYVWLRGWRDTRDHINN